MRVTGRHEHVETVVAVYHERHESRIEDAGSQKPPRNHARPTDPWPMLSDNHQYRAQPHNDIEFPAHRKLILQVYSEPVPDLHLHRQRRSKDCKVQVSANIIYLLLPAW